MRVITKRVLLAALVTSVLWIGCADRRSASLKAFQEYCLDIEEPLPHFDAYLTWSDFDGTPAEGAELYIWNGRELGRGREGFKKLLVELEGLRIGSTVLIYPDYLTIDNYELRGPGRQFPWYTHNDDWRALIAVRRARRLAFIYSLRDHLGVLTPLAKAVYDDYRAYSEKKR